MVVGRLQQHLDRRCGAAPEVLGEARRCHQHQISGFELGIVDGLGVADDPQHVTLPRCPPPRLHPSNHDVHVTCPPDRPVGVVGRLYTDLVAEAAQAAGQALAEVPVAPARRHLGRRRRHRDGEASRQRADLRDVCRLTSNHNRVYFDGVVGVGEFSPGGTGSCGFG